MADFSIREKGVFSGAFLYRGINTFKDACAFIHQLPYGRNADKTNLLTVFTDGCGTCSTKHALLKALAVENNFKDLDLMLGIFRMNAANVPAVSSVLSRYGLDYIPEAHNYLRFGKEVLDFTTDIPGSLFFLNDLLEEISIGPAQITDFKTDYHKKYLKKWLMENKSINFNPGELWQIREECIMAIGMGNNRLRLNVL